MWTSLKPMSRRELMTFSRSTNPGGTGVLRFSREYRVKRILHAGSCMYVLVSTWDNFSRPPPLEAVVSLYNKHGHVLFCSPRWVCLATWAQVRGTRRCQSKTYETQHQTGISSSPLQCRGDHGILEPCYLVPWSHRTIASFTTTCKLQSEHEKPAEKAAFVQRTEHHDSQASLYQLLGP